MQCMIDARNTPRTDKQAVLVSVADDEYSLCLASNHLRADKEAVLLAVVEDGRHRSMSRMTSLHGIASISSQKPTSEASLS